MKQVTTFFRHGLAGAVLLLGSWSGPAAQAQITWNPAVNPDYPLANAQATNVENTGSDYVPVQATAGQGNYLRVMCWDGDLPSIGWSYGATKSPGATGTSPLLGTRRGGVVSDPDVVADPGNFGSSVRAMPTVLLVYLWNGSVAYEVRRYDPVSNAMVSAKVLTPTVIASSRFGCSNPNVDVDGNGQAVITWSQANTGGVYAMVYDLPTQTAYAPCLVAQEPGYWLEQPDVATSLEQPGNPAAINTSFIFLANPSPGSAGSLSANTVHMVQVSTAQLKVRSSVNQGMGPNVIPQPSMVPSFDAPRIAAGIDGYASPTDFQAVVADLHDNFLYGLNASNSAGPVSAATLPTVTVLNAAGRLQSSAGCSRPVVSFCGDGITACWVMDESQVPGGRPHPSLNPYGGRDIVQLSMNWGGEPQNMWSSTSGVYAVVNDDQRGNQSAPSVSGRYTMGINTSLYHLTANACYSFFDDSQAEILYKMSEYYNTSLRPAGMGGPKATANPISASPNPLREQTTLTLSLAAGETVQALTVYSPTGQLVRQQSLEQAIGGQGTQQIKWDGTGLQAGLYLVRLRTSTGAMHTYRLQHE